jgi:hypothetical protein
MPDKPRTALFIHTGGLPGLLAEGPTLLGALAYEGISDTW